jgi:hypothetical protein
MESDRRSRTVESGCAEHRVATRAFRSEQRGVGFVEQPFQSGHTRGRDTHAQRRRDRPRRGLPQVGIPRKVERSDHRQRSHARIEPEALFDEHIEQICQTFLAFKETEQLPK